MAISDQWGIKVTSENISCALILATSKLYLWSGLFPFFLKGKGFFPLKDNCFMWTLDPCLLRDFASTRYFWFLRLLQLQPPSLLVLRSLYLRNPMFEHMIPSNLHSSFFLVNPSSLWPLQMSSLSDTPISVFIKVSIWSQILLKCLFAKQIGILVPCHVIFDLCSAAFLTIPLFLIFSPALILVCQILGVRLPCSGIAFYLSLMFHFYPASLNRRILWGPSFSPSPFVPLTTSCKSLLTV